MKFVWFVIAAALAAVIALDPALAAGKKRVRSACVDRPVEFSWSFLWASKPEPRGNGCAPAVYSAGRYLGQDPDPNIRLQLLRDPRSGYTAGEFQ